MATFTKQEVNEYIEDYKANTGEKISKQTARMFMEQQAEHDAEASDGSGEVYVNGCSTGFPYNPELSYTENRKLALAAREEANGVASAKAEADAAEGEVTDELPGLAPEQPPQDLEPELVGHPGVVEGVHVPEQSAVPAASGKGPTLQVKQGLSLRGGRGEWYKLLCQYDGKSLAEFVAAGKANPASHYTARSVKCGQPKTPESRLSWFKRAGIVTIK